MWSVRELWIQMVTQAASAAILMVLGLLLGGHFGLNGVAFAMIASIAFGALMPMGRRAWKLTTRRAEPHGDKPVETAALSPVVKGDIAG